MTLSKTTQHILEQIRQDSTRLGDLRKIAKEIKKDHLLAMELWSTGEFLPRQLAILIMDKKLLTEDLVNQLDKDIQDHPYDQCLHLADWLLANQLTKDKKTIALLESWENSPSPIQRRLFWYYQARLRWTGNTPPENTEVLLSSIEKNMAEEEPEVQWAMNFTAGWIGVHEAVYRKRCIALGERIGLFKGEKVSRGCTPNYLPEFIKMEAAKLNK